MDYFILDDSGEPVVATADEWGKWFQNHDRVLKVTNIGDYSGQISGNLSKKATPRGAVTISTVFLGLNHSWGGANPPILWETMVFNGPLDQETQRYSTKDEALRGHAEMVERVERELQKMLAPAPEKK